MGTSAGQNRVVMAPAHRKGGAGAKRKRIGKQGGGGGNRGASGPAPRRPMAIPKRAQRRSASDDDQMPAVSAAMGSRPTNETVTVTATHTNSTGKATVNSSGIYVVAHSLSCTVSVYVEICNVANERRY